MKLVNVQDAKANLSRLIEEAMAGEEIVIADDFDAPLDEVADLFEGRGIVERRFLELPVRVRHARALGDLPALHRDPFDRLLVAQAIVEEPVIVTADDAVAAYPARTLRA